MTKRWYVVHAYSGFEKQVKRSLEDRVRRAGMEDKFGEVLVPTEEVVEMKGGQKRRSDRKFFPGYVLVEMEMTDDAWHLVRNTPKVLGGLTPACLEARVLRTGDGFELPWLVVSEAGGRLLVQLAERFGKLVMTLEMPFKDATATPDPLQGWSPERCEKLAHSCLDALHLSWDRVIG